MSYIRSNSKLPSGKISTSYVYPGEKGLLNMCRTCADITKQTKIQKHEEEYFLLISYGEMCQILKNNSPEKVENIIKTRLDLDDEEAEHVCKRLFKEYEAGKWDDPSEWETS